MTATWVRQEARAELLALAYRANVLGVATQWEVAELSSIGDQIEREETFNALCTAVKQRDQREVELLLDALTEPGGAA